MQTLRNAYWIARFVLVWFALFIGASVASPVLNPNDLQMVCTASGGMKLVSASDDGVEVQTSSGMDCPLCATVSPPLPLFEFTVAKPSSLAHALQPSVVAHIASATAPPLPSRGPPALSL